MALSVLSQRFPMSSLASFRVTYDGEALERHTMDVRELAPALLALGDLVESASLALYGDNVQVKVEVKASFKTGSFGIDFLLSQDFREQVLSFLNSPGTTAFINAAELVGILFGSMVAGKKGLTSVLKWIKNRKIKTVQIKEDNATIITVDDDALETDARIIKLLQNRSVREHLASTLVPLQKDGITTVAFGNDDGCFYEIIEKDEIRFFELPQEEDTLIVDEKQRMAFSIISLTFKEDNKWRLHDGNATIHALITDAEFLSRVDQNLETFSKGDVLVCQVHVRQWHAPEGAKTEYTVEKIIEHRQAMRQITLPFSDENTNGVE